MGHGERVTMPYNFFTGLPMHICNGERPHWPGPRWANRTRARESQLVWTDLIDGDVVIGNRNLIGCLLFLIGIAQARDWSYPIRMTFFSPLAYHMSTEQFNSTSQLISTHLQVQIYVVLESSDEYVGNC